MKNYYEDKPLVPYRKSIVEMGLVVDYLKKVDAPVEVKRAAYIMFRFESGNGQKGLNNNFIGAQADSGRWPAKFDTVITGVVRKQENGTNADRLFLQFNSWSNSLDFLIDRVEQRGLYVGGFESRVTKTQITDSRDLAIAYKRSWVTGNKRYNPSEAEISSFLSMYRQAAKIFV
ncbi:hypothetical protein [Chitinophaga pinensis]|uniref:Uncharacterized protein n=1 Tax=Chitinophaga pinensis (strain ATCC 43595 / DSM 2588 / LMG 13176 / NBRC 15968 / NCIMB 11800 / UQM 2034) TaxID=485918 RepID=A0A979G5R1_CHIPD|nr:hypothetical protein [Chitinophaga pinensis]ACU61374.1 hypothetical protein Cpin_3912 [Chitinophaga pinensis DSM 2588]